MATKIIAGNTPATEAQNEAVRALDDADRRCEDGSKRLRALSSAIRALLPANVMKHPAFDVDHLDPRFGTLIELRDGLNAVRELADMVDDVACQMGIDAQQSMFDARKALDLPAPAWA